MSSLANGGCTSTKYDDLMYLDANLPKCTSSKLAANMRMKSTILTELMKHVHDAARLRDAEEADSGCDDQDDNEQLPLSGRQV